jgi:hypothetical protein
MVQVIKPMIGERIYDGTVGSVKFLETDMPTLWVKK